MENTPSPGPTGLTDDRKKDHEHNTGSNRHPIPNIKSPRFETTLILV